MKSQIDIRFFAAVVAVIAVIVGVVVVKRFASSPANSPAISAEQAGLGKPVTPIIPGSK